MNAALPASLGIDLSFSTANSKIAPDRWFTCDIFSGPGGVVLTHDTALPQPMRPAAQTKVRNTAIARRPSEQDDNLKIATKGVGHIKWSGMNWQA
jgi:hypothetical protein